MTRHEDEKRPLRGVFFTFLPVFLAVMRKRFLRGRFRLMESRALVWRCSGSYMWSGCWEKAGVWRAQDHVHKEGEYTDALHP